MAREFELTRNITIGQYLPTGSFVHRLDPRIKLFSFGILILAIAFCNSYGGNFIVLGFSLLLFRLSRIPLRYGLSGVKPAIPFIVILAVLQLLFYGDIASGGRVYLEYGFIVITSDSVRLVIVSALRFIEIIFVSSVLTLSTSTTQLTHGMESLLKPLKYVKFPVHEFSLIMTIAIRFVPTFAMEMEKMIKAQASRGAEFGTGSWWQIFRRTKEMLPIIVPLFRVAMERAEDLILAMEARCYTPGGTRSRFRTYQTTFRDGLTLLFILCFSLLLWMYPFPY